MPQLPRNDSRRPLRRGETSREQAPLTQVALARQADVPIELWRRPSTPAVDPSTRAMTAGRDHPTVVVADDDVPPRLTDTDHPTLRHRSSRNRELETPRRAGRRMTSATHAAHPSDCGSEATGSTGIPQAVTAPSWMCTTPRESTHVDPITAGSPQHRPCAPLVAAIVVFRFRSAPANASQQPPTSSCLQACSPRDSAGRERSGEGKGKVGGNFVFPVGSRPVTVRAARC